MSNPNQKSQNSQSTRTIVLQILCIVIVILAICAMATPVIMKSTKNSYMTTTTNNAKQIFYLLVEFDQDFGEFPSDKTAQEIEGYDGSLSGDYSNDYFRQFIAENYTQSEEIFYASRNTNSKKPDNIITPPAEALSLGECGFTYIKGLSTKDNPATPLVLAPMYGDGVKFDPYPYDSKAVVLRVDGSVKQLRLNKNHHAIIRGDKTLFEGGADTVWGEKGFDKSRLVYAGPPYKPRYPLANKLFNRITFLGFVIFLGISYILFSIFRFLRKKGEPSHE